ncbi:MAG: hypothetical protein RBR43_04520 [Desulfuromonadaceae bacterium]|nr:hypothetical protein [Desulfuromonadaceae bacterium]
MHTIRLFSFQTVMALLLCSTILLSGCSNSSSHDANGTIQMGGSIQGNELVLTGETATLVGEDAPPQDGYRTSVVIDTPFGITSDGDNLYVTEMRNHIIRKIELASGAVTTLTGVAGESGAEDSSEGIARFNTPVGITTDGINLYVCDERNNTIRQVVLASGVVSTLAGGVGEDGFVDGTGSDARFDGPNSIATDGTNLYVVDNWNLAIRQVVIATGVVTTLAGGADDSAADFNYPNGIATDGETLYVADTQNNTIRQVEIATGVVTTLAGNTGEQGSSDGIGSAARFIRPSGVFLQGDHLYVTDGAHTLRKILISTGEVTTLAGVAEKFGAHDDIGIEAQFSAPKGIVAVGTRLYVSDLGNDLIRSVDMSTSENTVATFAGFLRHVFIDMTTDGTNLYVSDEGTQTIQKIEIASGAMTTLAGRFGMTGATDGDTSVACFNYPTGITTDGTNLYVCDFYNHAVRKVNIASGEVSTLAGSAGTSGSADGIGSAAEFRSPYGITTDGTNLYVVDREDRTIRQIEIATGAVTTLVGEAAANDGVASLPLSFPGGITTDGTNLYLAETSFHTIYQIDIATGAMTALAGSGNAFIRGSADGTGSEALFNGPRNITTDGTNLYVTDRGNNTIRKIELATGVVTTLTGNVESSGSTDGPSSVALFEGPSGITTDGKKIYVVDDFTKVRSIR